jgi:hypothetical protein
MTTVLVASGDRKEDNKLNVSDWTGTGVEGVGRQRTASGRLASLRA